MAQQQSSMATYRVPGMPPQQQPPPPPAAMPAPQVSANTGRGRGRAGGRGKNSTAAAAAAAAQQQQQQQAAAAAAAQHHHLPPYSQLQQPPQPQNLLPLQDHHALPPSGHQGGDFSDFLTQMFNPSGGGGGGAGAFEPNAFEPIDVFSGGDASAAVPNALGAEKPPMTWGMGAALDANPRSLSGGMNHATYQGLGATAPPYPGAALPAHAVRAQPYPGAPPHMQNSMSQAAAAAAAAAASVATSYGMPASSAMSVPPGYSAGIPVTSIPMQMMPQGPAMAVRAGMPPGAPLVKETQYAPVDVNVLTPQQRESYEHYWKELESARELYYFDVLQIIRQLTAQHKEMPEGPQKVTLKQRVTALYQCASELASRRDKPRRANQGITMDCHKMIGKIVKNLDRIEVLKKMRASRRQAMAAQGMPPGVHMQHTLPPGVPGTVPMSMPLGVLPPTSATLAGSHMYAHDPRAAAMAAMPHMAGQTPSAAAAAAAAAAVASAAAQHGRYPPQGGMIPMPHLMPASHDPTMPPEPLVMPGMPGAPYAIPYPGIPTHSAAAVAAAPPRRTKSMTAAEKRLAAAAAAAQMQQPPPPAPARTNSGRGAASKGKNSKPSAKAAAAMKRAAEAAAKAEASAAAGPESTDVPSAEASRAPKDGRKRLADALEREGDDALKRVAVAVAAASPSVELVSAAAAAPAAAPMPAASAVSKAESNATTQPTSPPGSAMQAPTPMSIPVDLCSALPAAAVSALEPEVAATLTEHIVKTDDKAELRGEEAKSSPLEFVLAKDVEAATAIAAEARDVRV